MLKLTREDLQHIAPRPKTPKKAAVWDGYVDALTSPEGAALFERYGVNSPLRLQHCLAQWSGAETGGFTVLHESGAYTAAGILRVFGPGKHSSPVSEEEAREIAALPVYDDGSGPRADRLFERVYGYLTIIGPKMGNTQPGDGSEFRGLGLNEATGKFAYMKACAKIGCTLEELVQPINLLHVALIEWQEKNCNFYADRDDCISIRKLINAGTLRVSLSRINGLPQAQAALKLAKNVITWDDFPADQVADASRHAIGANGGPPLDADVPAKGDHLQPPNEYQPDALWQSTEMHAGAAGTVTSGATASAKVLSFMPRAIGTATATGRFSLMSFAFAVLSDPEAWEAAGAMLAAGGCIYLMVQRFKRFHIWGM